MGTKLYVPPYPSAGQGLEPAYRQRGFGIAGESGFSLPGVLNFDDPSFSVNDDSAALIGMGFDDAFGTNGAIRASGYGSTDPALNFTNGWTADTNSTTAGVRYDFGAGNGVTPSDGFVVRVEAVMESAGTGANNWIYLFNDTRTDGLQFSWNETNLTFFTRHNNTPTNKYSVDDGLGSIPGGPIVLSCEYNFSTYLVRMRIMNDDLTLNSGWFSNTISTPTYAVDLELRELQLLGQTSVAGNVQILQGWYNIGTAVAFPDGAARTHNVP